MKCPNCGMEGSGKFCAQCGAPLPAEEQPQNFQVPQPKPKKPLFKCWWFWVIVVIILLSVLGRIGDSLSRKDAAAPNQSSAVGTKVETADKNQQEAAPEPAPAEVATTYVLKSGYYVAGVDIPAGTCKVTAVSGQGNLMSSNMFNGGVNELFGIDDGTGFYTSTFNGLKLPKDTVLSSTSGLVIQLDFSEVTAGCTGRSYDEAGAVTLGTGNYTAGTDFAPGVYKLVAVSGTGNLSSSNLMDGGVNEMFGVDDGSGWYNPEFVNAVFQSGVTLSVSGGVTVQLIPAVLGK